jgi:hypothetical protein
VARLWQCGFELNSTSTGMEFTTSSGTISLQTGTVRTGTYALRANPTASTGFVRWHAFATDQAIVGYQRFYLNIATLPSTASSICRFLDTTNASTGAIRLSTTGTLQLLNAAGTQIGSSSATLSTGTWYMVELKTDATGAGALDARLDGSSFASGANSAQGNWSRVLIGVIGSNATTDLAFDDWAVNDASGSAQNSWPGSGKILHLLPNGDGDAHAWGNTANGAGASTNYTLVNEVPPNDATTLVQSVTLNAEDMYTLTDSGIGSGDIVNVAMVGVRIRDNSADAVTTAKVQVKKVTGGTIAQGSAIVPNTASFFTNGPAEPRNYTLITYADPDGSPWTQATLDTAQAGVKLTVAGTNRIQVSALWVSVDYTPSSSTPVSSSDTGSGAEASTLAAALSSADTGAGAEASSLAATASSADTGAGTEAASLVAQISDADTGTSTEAATLATALLSADTGAGTEQATDRNLTAAETAGAADTATLAAGLTSSDTAAGTDASALTTSLTSADTASGAEASTLAAQLLSAETGTAGDAGTVDDGSGSSQNVSSADTATAVEAATVTAVLTSADTGTAADAATLAAQLVSADTATSTDVASLTAALIAAETASIAEAAVLNAALIAADTGSAQEAADADDGIDEDPLPPVVALITVTGHLAATITPTGQLSAIATRGE